MAEKYGEKERRITLALAELSESSQPNLSVLARKYDVPNIVCGDALLAAERAANAVTKSQ
jgi:hypothetical protein